MVKPQTKPKARNKRGGGNANIDWDAARMDYVGDATVTYTMIAKKYGVSKAAAANHGLKHGWAELRQKLSDRAFERFSEQMATEKSKAQENHTLHYRNIQALANMKIKKMSSAGDFEPQDLRAVAQSMKIGIDGERIVLGLPTSVSAITPGDNEQGKGWSDLLALAMREAGHGEQA